MSHFRGYQLVFPLLLHGLMYNYANGALSQDRLNELCKGYSEETISHPEDTQKFIYCDANGNGTEVTCKQGACYDSIKSVCVETSKACVKTIPKGEVSSEDCNSDDFLMKKLSSNDCNSYYMCIAFNESPKKFQCPRYQHYSKFQEQCLDIWQAMCEPHRLWCKDFKDGDKLRAEKSYQYYECSRGESVLQTCAYYQCFNGTDCVRTTCFDKDGVAIDRKPNCLNHDSEYLPHSKCNMYYVCRNDIPMEVQCPDGYYFHEIRKKCEKDIRNECYYV